MIIINFGMFSLTVRTQWSVLLAIQPATSISTQVIDPD